MTIDSDYLASSVLEQYFVDKDSGTPLSNGLVYFWEDNNRSVPKSVYQITGSPPNYTFTALPNPMPLSSVGTPEDGSGNNVIPYYYPFGSDGNNQLYYVEVYSEGSILQFTREAWPPDAVQQGGSDQENSTLNLIPNGQFKLHNNIVADNFNNISAGQITGPVTEIAPGGWTFERPNTTTANDNVSFFRFNSYTENPTSSPRYAARLTTDGGSPSDSFKDFRIKYNDVNKFASDTQEYTIFFSAKTFSGPDFSLELNLIKNYGTGGSAQEAINIDSFTITSTQTDFSTTIIFGSNTGKAIGSLNDDYAQICFSCPTGTPLGVDLTDFVMMIGNINVTQFPITTDKDFIDRSLVPGIPNYDGYDIGLPLVNTKSGLIFDDSQVGKVYSTISHLPAFGELLCDGAIYRSDAYSSDGIPYRRLRNKLITTAATGAEGVQNVPIFGTGEDYVTASHINDDGTFYISLNKLGLQTAIADGSSPTGFTFTTVSPGQSSASNIGVTSYVTGDASLSYYWIICNDVGVIPYTFTGNYSTTPTQILNPYPEPTQGEIVGTPQVNSAVKVQSTAVPAASSYVGFSTPTKDILYWFTLDGVGSNPVPGAPNPIQINLLSNMGLQDTAYGISQSLNGRPTYTVKVLSGASVVPNSYFTFYANSQLYYVWYSLNGSGIDPSVAGGIGIEVSYLLSDTVKTVMLKSLNTINDLYFAAPDLRGWTIKGWDNGGIQDKNTLFRYSLANNRYNMGNVALYSYIGSYQLDGLLSHSHTAALGSPVIFGLDSAITFSNGTNNVGLTSVLAQNYVSNNGTAQNDVKNVFLNYVIKY